MTERPQLLIVAHGWPRHPAVAEAELAWLAHRVGRHLPVGAVVLSATLAAPDALERAVARTDPRRPVAVYPFFMSDGWFVSDHLKARIGACGRRDIRWLDPFGLDPGLPALCAAQIGAGFQGSDPARATLIVVAHGSPDNPRPSEIARAMTEGLAARLGFRAHRTGFVDETPGLEDVLRLDGPSVCLPFFATLSGHMRHDLPEAAARAGYTGPMLPAIGTAQGVPEVIAETVRSL